VKRAVIAAALPRWIRPQLTQLVDQAPEGGQWLHEIKFDGYRVHARLDRRAVKLLTRTGLDWTHEYLAIAAAVSSLPARQAYLDGELCGVGPDGITSLAQSSWRPKAAMPRVLPVRSSVRRWRRFDGATARRSEDQARCAAVECDFTAALLRSPTRPRLGIS